MELSQSNRNLDFGWQSTLKIQTSGFLRKRRYSKVRRISWPIRKRQMPIKSDWYCRSKVSFQKSWPWRFSKYNPPKSDQPLNVKKWLILIEIIRNRTFLTENIQNIILKYHFYLWKYLFESKITFLSEFQSKMTIFLMNW